MKRDGGHSNILVIVPVCILLGFVTGLLYSNNQLIENNKKYDDIINGLQTELNQKSGEINSLIESNNELKEQMSDKLEYIRNLNNTLDYVIEEKTNATRELYTINEKYKSYDEDMNELKWDNVRLKSRLGDRLNWKTYSNYDFSFEYPEEMELSIIDEGYDLGSILNINYFDPANYLYFSWLNVEMFNPEEIVEDVEEEHDELKFDRKDIIETEVFGHEAYFYYFAIEVGDGVFHGILCTWYCQNTNRIFVLFQYSSGDPLTSFVNILGTMKCHSIGDLV